MPDESHMPAADDAPEFRGLDATRLGRDLRGLHGSIEVPGSIDAEIRGRLRAVDAPAPRLRFRRVALAAAAMLALSVLVWRVVAPGPPPPGPTLNVAKLAGDYDRSGRVDLLDAFRLARDLEGGPDGLEPGADVNGDGRATMDDVEWIARRAVALEPVDAGGVGS